jgi:predicted O-methyltransferase YrrM
MLARAKGVRNIIEFGTSHAISTIYLALAVRDNGGGKVVSSGTTAPPLLRAGCRRCGREIL